MINEKELLHQMKLINGYAQKKFRETTTEEHKEYYHGFVNAIELIEVRIKNLIKNQ